MCKPDALQKIILASSSPTIVDGEAFNDISTTVEMPPAAADLVPVSNPSFATGRGSLKYT
ncbi:MAG: hypothetical protein AAGD96_31595 [Chloroflexota bacterium]